MSTPTDNTSIAEVTVLRLLPFGLLVRLPDERIGIVREREIAWDARQRRNWRRQFKRGDMYRAVVLGMAMSAARSPPLLALMTSPTVCKLDFAFTAIIMGNVPIKEMGSKSFSASKRNEE